MDLQQAFSSQYLAALAMMEQSIDRCPAELWIDGGDQNQFWHIAYHAIFYTHLYLQETHAAFTPWPKHRHELHRLSVQPDAPYTRAEVLEYLAFCRAEVAHRLTATDFAAPSGFEWLPFDKLELQVYNLRHLHQHIGELGALLGLRGIEIDWVGRG